MPDFTQPSEIAREVLVRLAQKRIQPTPDHYLTLYHEIAGTSAAEVFPEKSLKSLISGLPRQTSEQLKLARQFEQAVTANNWAAIGQILNNLVSKIAATGPNWSETIRDVLNQLDARSVGLTPAKKRESLEHVLASSATPDLLHQRLQSLLRAWSQVPGAAEAPLADEPAAAEPASASSAPHAAPAAGAVVAMAATTGGSPIAELQGLIAHLLTDGVAPLVGDDQDLSALAQKLAADVRGARSIEQLANCGGQLKKLTYRLQFVAEDQGELKSALLHLLRLLVENIDQLAIDDKWLQGQISIVSELINQPLNLRRLDDVERRLKDLIYKQSALKKDLSDAQDRLKAMLATFVDRLADFSNTTTDYHDTIERCAQRISQAGDIGELTDVLDEVMRETRNIQVTAQRSRDEMSELRQRAREAEQKIEALQNELAEASDMVRHDALTGVLNRKGMDEALEREVGRNRRHASSLCVALLDIDNFKRLNDTLGHEAGDAALKHLAQVVRETIRPQDTLARYGGEEFVILLPDTPLEDGINAMTRVQRELTKKFFLHRNEKVLITFSCGVAELVEAEEPASALHRADEAMYMAKRSGKNRVVAA